MNADLAGQGMHLDDAPARAVGDRIEIAADRQHTFAGDAAIEGKDDIEGRCRHRLKVWLFLGEVLQDGSCRIPMICSSVHRDRFIRPPSPQVRTLTPRG